MSFSRLNSLTRIPNCGAAFKALKVNSPNLTPTKSILSKVSLNSRNGTIQTNALFHSSRFLKSEEKAHAKEEKKVEVEESESEESEGKPKEKVQDNRDPNDPEVKIEALQKEVDELKSKLVYSYAERENLRRISNIEVEKAKDFGIQNFAKSLLDSADNFVRCLQAAKKEDLEASPAFKSFYEGVEMTEKIFAKALNKNGIEKLEPHEEKFDPHTMNALMFMPDPKKANGMVGAVLKPGYSLNKRIIRPADVGVVRNQAPDSE